MTAPPAALLRFTVHACRLARRAGVAPIRRMPMSPERMPSLQLRLPAARRDAHA